MDKLTTIAQSALITALRYKSKECADFISLWVMAVHINEVLDLGLGDEIVTEAAKYMQRCLQLPDIDCGIVIIL